MSLVTSRFLAGRTPRFTPPTVTVARCGRDHQARHLFAPCIHQHSNGQLLIVCRWDRMNEDEGTATNEQALFFSQDAGTTWTLAGGGPILTCANGSSFSAPSSLTHAWLLDDLKGSTWLYYTINQPFTWGEDCPDRSTGGGEIRRQEIYWNGLTWCRKGESMVVWGFQRPLPDGAGGTCDNIRIISWNGLVRTRAGTLVMPVGGRASVQDPRGAFSPLDRVWVLISHDDGVTWPEAHFVGGGDTLCLAEPTLVETSTPGELVCLLRVQYGTGDQLHRSVSRDGGCTWSQPLPSGLPQSGAQGVKPFLLRRRSGDYALIQTNEHEVIERTNIAVFFTDEAGLLTDTWPRIRTLHIGNRRGWWPGSCYGWLADDGNGDLLAAFPCYDPDGGRLLFSRLSADYPDRAEMVEPNGVVDEWGDHVPKLDGAMTPGGEISFVFDDVRGRLIAPNFGMLAQNQREFISLKIWIERLPSALPFVALRLTSRNGSEVLLELFLDRNGWDLQAGKMTRRIGVPADDSGWLDISCQTDAERATVGIGRAPRRLFEAVVITESPTGFQIGGSALPGPCRIHVGEVTYGSAELPLADQGGLTS